MAKIFITGSADGLGQMAATLLISQGHQVVLHARNPVRGEEALKRVPTAAKVLIADLSDFEETKKLAADVNALGRFDAVIHNAGVYQTSNKQIFAVNTLAPYILTALIQKPARLIYLSSGMHMQGHSNLNHFISDTDRINYSDSKLHVVLLAKAVARRWPTVLSNAVDPGWVPTKMGGASAPDDLEKGFQTQAWLAVSTDQQAQVSGRYFFHQKQKQHAAEANEISLQEKFLALCEQITGISFPE
jgi:NAD(P)-dependent dehydrogenase (short-subunit alcohol dehydrogenase family)